MDLLNDDWGSARQDLLHVYQAALAAVEGRRVTRQWLLGTAANGEPPFSLVAVGKAAFSMAQGALDALGSRIASALVISKRDHCGVDDRLACLEAGHPMPDEASLGAGQALLRFLQEAPPRQPLLFLVSGGASALVEVLPAGVGLEDLRAANRWLLASGWDIHQMNRVRKALSCIKAGRLARHLERRAVLHLLMSDVVDGDPSAIGSGLLVPDPEARQRLSPGELPDWLEEKIGRAPPAPLPDDPIFHGIHTAVIAENATACAAAADAAQQRGYRVIRHDRPLHGDARRIGKSIAGLLQDAPPGFHIWGGETTVTLPDNPGRGGRCQQLALAAAVQISGREDVHLLAASTDGTDGPTDDAGALVDGGTLLRGEREGFDALACLRRADAGAFLEASGDLIQTGPTGSNVVDLVFAIKACG